MADNVIEFSHVTKEYKGFSLSDVNLSIKQGYVTGLIGINGSGKSTLIKLIMNLLTPDKGCIETFGLDNNRSATQSKEIKEQIGFVYDKNIYYENLKIKELNKILKHSYEKWDNKLFYQYVEKFGLPLNKTLKSFSKGTQMKMSLAVALSHHAQLIIMDEPFAGLDAAFRRELVNLLREVMLDAQCSIFFTTHLVEELENFADYIALIDQGEVLFNQTLEELKGNFAIVKGSQMLLDRDIRSYFITINYTNNGFVAMTDQIEEVTQSFGSYVTIEVPTLADILYYLKKETL